MDALFAHAGVLRAETVGEMFDVAGLLARQPLPRGDRVAVLTNAGGPGVACVDACEAAGLRAADPVDLTAAATADDYERSLRALLAGDARRRGRDRVRALAVRGRRGGRPRDRRGGRREAAGARRVAGRRQPAAAWAASTRPRRRCGRSPTPSGTRGAGRRRPTRRSSRPTPTPRRPRRSSPRGWGGEEASWRRGTSSACCAAGASRWWRAGSWPRRAPRAARPRSSAARSR